MQAIPSSEFVQPEAPITRRGLLSSHRWLAAAVDLVFPPRCGGCGRVDTHWCARCQRELDALPLATDIRTLPPILGIAYTGLHTGKLQHMIHGLKYENATQLAQPLGERLARRLTQLNWKIDIVVPVPLHRSRERRRGYNQAKLLVEAVAGQLMQPYATTALTRERNTTSQVGLNGAQRRANVQNAFRGDPQRLAARTILLIDDVYTTGATLAACAQAALDAGAKAVYGLTVTAAQ